MENKNLNFQHADTATLCWVILIALLYVHLGTYRTTSCSEYAFTQSGGTGGAALKRCFLCVTRFPFHFFVRWKDSRLQCDCGLHATSVRGGLTERFLNATEKRYGPTCSVSGCQLTKHRELMTRNKLIHFILKCLWHRVKRKDITATEQCGGCNMGNTFLDIQWQKPKCWVTDFPARGAARGCLPCSDCIWFPARRHSVIP